MDKKYLIAAAVLVGVAILGYLFYLSTKPLVGEKQAEDCNGFIDNPQEQLRDPSITVCQGHVKDGVQVRYKTNPPTYGPHDPTWVRAGVYPDGKDDRNLVHSLEHGYVILSYKCKVKSEKSSEATGSAEASGSASLDTQTQCDQRKDELSKIYEKKGKGKLVVVARPSLDTDFALTAWLYIDKFNGFDQKRIEQFINDHRDRGPEQTME